MKAISSRRFAAVAAAAACMVIGTATSASAASADSPKSYAFNGDGWAYFVANGDEFKIHDSKCDGDTVWAQLSWYKSGYGWNFRTIRNISGCGTTDTEHPWNIPEGADVTVQACGSVGDGFVNTGAGMLTSCHDAGSQAYGTA